MSYVFFALALLAAGKTITSRHTELWSTAMLAATLIGIVAAAR